MFRKIDLGIIAATSALALLGIIMIYSTAGSELMTKQTIWLIFSVFVALFFSRVSPRIWTNLAPIIYILSVFFIFIILFKSDVYPRRWIRLGEFSIQPSEFVKFATVLMLANYLAAKKRLETFSDMIVP
ncbi:FtsW/RodA/SpoVE family cell cycle protein, partial [candidate division WOR-3 bacterium]|nr:FtsW/RodA/SpoVE family cell cycle protein [candidate division WOR-3 bacterium]